MLHVSMNVSTLDSKNITGIGNYVKYMTNALAKRNDLKISGSYRISRFKNRKIIQSHLPGLPLYPLMPIHPFRNFDILHGPDYRSAIVPGAKTVVTIPDLSYFYREYVSQRFHEFGKHRIETLIKKYRPDFIITISDFIKEEIIERYPQYQDRIKTTYLGCDHISEQPQKRKFEFPYFLSVGSLEKRKNPDVIIKAFEIAHEKLPHMHLVISGGNGNNAAWSDLVRDQIKNSIAKSHIHYLGYTDEAELPSLFAHALCFLFPSLYEGFGIPILEAMKYGCPVITSNRGAMKEISGEAARLVDPTNIEDVASAMIEIEASTQLQFNLKEKGLEQSKKFTWEKCANSTFEIYKNIVI